MTGVIVATILEFVDGAGNKTGDAAVVAAIRGCLNASSPSGEHSWQLHQRLEAIEQRGDVDLRSFRSSLNELMKLAKDHKDPNSNDAFIRYLAVLAG